MDQERLTFVFGDEDFDEDDLRGLDDPEELAYLLEDTFALDLRTSDVVLYQVVARQILDDDPAVTWTTAQRLLAAGLDRDEAFAQLAAACRSMVMAATNDESGYDGDAYAAALASLPMPTDEEIAEAIIAEVRAEPGVIADELDARVLARFGQEAPAASGGPDTPDTPDTPLVSTLYRLLDDMIDGNGPLAYAGDDQVVHVGDLTEGIVLTCRVGDTDKEIGGLNAAFDLAGFARRHDLTLPTGDALDVFGVEHGHLRWTGPDGWLDDVEAGTVVAVRVDPGGVVHLEPLAAEPAIDPALVARLRAAYDGLVEESWLPVSAEDLVLALLLEDRATFAAPTAPLADLAAAADLERELDRVAHDVTVWHNLTRSQRIGRTLGLMDDDYAGALKVLHMLDVADLVFGIDMTPYPDIEGPADAAMLRAVLADLADGNRLSTLMAELFDSGEVDARPRAEAFIEALLGAAHRPREKALAHLPAAVSAERSLEPDVGEQHLKLAHAADPTMGAVIDRLAWYASDRGDAVRAAQLWRDLEPTPVIERDLAAIAPFATPRASTLGRNDPCWCGSGRKYKQCHLGEMALVPLPERVNWLIRKSIAYFDRYGFEAHQDLMEIAYQRATDPHDRDSIVEAFADPIVMDLALTEGGWFARFLEARGALLPGDEALLAQAWLLVDRSIFEVVAVERGIGLTMRDLRTADEVEVRERTFSRETQEGERVCARIVPDGESHTIVGGLFRVAPGREASLFKVLDFGDPEEIASWVAGSFRAPALQTREGEPMVQCDLIIDTGDADAARAFLDATYEGDDQERDENEEADEDEEWVELFALNEDEEIVRAHLTLTGSHIEVSTTSEARAERVLAAVLAAFPDARVLADEREPVDLASMRRLQARDGLADLSAPGPDGPNPLDDPEIRALVEQQRDGYEERWCDESIPALGGVTPREAAADPTRRGDLERLLATFEPIDHDMIGMRPARLRELLDL